MTASHVVSNSRLATAVVSRVGPLNGAICTRRTEFPADGSRPVLKGLSKGADAS